MRIFIDVGAHYGETLAVALDPAWGFDRILVLEPASACQPLLRKFRDRRIILHPVAIGRANQVVKLYGAGQLGASVYETKRQKAEAADLTVEQIELRRASEWFRANVPDDAEVFMKFNCEGAECDIIEDLLDAGLGSRLTSLYIDFDIRKVDGQAHRQAEVEQRLRHANVRFVTSDELTLGANPAVARWLRMECTRAPVPWKSALAFRLGLYAPLYVQLKGAARALLPASLYSWLGGRFGRMARARH